MGDIIKSFRGGADVYESLRKIYYDLSTGHIPETDEELLRFVNEVIGKVPGVTRTRTAIVPWKLKDVYQWHVPAEAAEEGRAIG